MKHEGNIIAIRKRDSLVHKEAFASLMNKTEQIMNHDARTNPRCYQNISPSDLEHCSVNKIKEACNNTPFNPNEIVLISGHKFPDIVAEKYYGIEVKSTISDTWTSIGSSIVETTRIKDVEDIYEIGFTNDPWKKLGIYKEKKMNPGTTMVPRVLKTNVGDIFTTNMIANAKADVTVGKILVPDAANKGILTVKATPATGDMQWQVVKVYTMPDGQAGVKIMRIA